jgi:hypothetical protein
VNARSRKKSERLRWWIADVLNRSKRTCWADLVTWALDGRNIEGGRLPQPFRSAAQCAAEAKTCGGCYCGKFRDLTATTTPAKPPAPTSHHDDPWSAT